MKKIVIKNNIITMSIYIFIVIISIKETIASKWPEFSTPKDSRLVVVSDDMVYNGVLMRSWELNSNKGSDYIKKFYINLWGKDTSEDSPAYLIDEFEKWTIVSRVEGDYMMTVQIDSGNKKTGHALLAISNLPSKNSITVIGEGFPRPDRSRVLSDIHSNDIGKKSRTLIIQSEASMSKNYRFYRNKFINKGWIEISKPNERLNNLKALVMVKGSDELNITFEKMNKKTSIVVVMVETT